MHSHNHCCSSYEKENIINYEFILNIIGLIIFTITIISKFNYSINLVLFVISYLLIGFKIIRNAIKSIFNGEMFDENFLMVLATIGAFFIGEYIEGIVVLIFYKVGEYLQDKAVEKSRERIAATLNLKPEFANVKVGNNINVVNPATLKIGDIIVIKNGEKIPVDGKVIKGMTLLDVSMLTGESIPKNIKKGDLVISGSINIDSLIEVEVTTEYKNSTIAKIIDLIENADNNKSDSEKFITKFAKIYTPVVILISVLIALIPPLFASIDTFECIRRALIFLVVSCPCALVLSIPLGYFSGIGTCSKKNILVKGSNFLDYLANVKTVVFDKTGTLTKGSFNVTKIVSTSDLNEQEILKYIALCESFSNHPIAKSVINKYDGRLDSNIVKNYHEIAGSGIKAIVESQEVLVGNDKLLDRFKINYNIISETGTILHLVIDKDYKGYVVVADELKEDSKRTIEGLKKLGISNLVMLTGDNNKVATKIASELGIDKVYSELLPPDKVMILNEIKKENTNGKVIFVGDGINDGPVLTVADIGISMQAGSDIAIESADVILMTNETSKIIDAIKISKKTKRIVFQNITFAITVKIIFLMLSSIGLTTMWFAVFADVGVSLIAVLNSLRIMR